MWLINWVVGIQFNILKIFNQLILKLIFKVSCWSVFILWQYVWLVLHHLSQILNLNIFISKKFTIIFFINWFNLRKIWNYFLLWLFYLTKVVLISKFLLEFIIFLKSDILFFRCIFNSVRIILIIYVELINIVNSWAHWRLLIKLSDLHLLLAIHLSGCVCFLIFSCVILLCICFIIKINLKISIIYVFKFRFILL